MFYSYDSVVLALTNTIPVIRHVGLCQKLFSQIQLLMFKVMLLHLSASLGANIWN